MTLLAGLFHDRGRNSRSSSRGLRSRLRLERLESRRALAADDGSDPWADPNSDGSSGDEYHTVDVTVVDDPSFDVTVVGCWLPPLDENGEPIVDPLWRGGVFVTATSGEDGGVGDPTIDTTSLPDCWLPPPFDPGADEGDGSTTDGGDGSDTGWVGGDGEWDPSWTYRSDDGGADDGDDPIAVPTSGGIGDFTFMVGGPGHAPTDVVATPSDDGIVVTWIDPAAAPGDGDIAFSNGYLVEMRRLRDATWSLAGTARDTTSLTVAGLDAGAHYVFRVTKTNIGLMQVLSSPSLPSRPVTTAGAEGINVAITDAGGAIITWDATAASGERIVEYRRLASADWSRVGAFPGATGAAAIDGLPGGRHFTFRILSPTGVYTPRTRAITTPDEVDYTLVAVAGPAGTVVNWVDPQAASRTETVVEYRRLKDAVWADLGVVATAAGAVKIDGLVSNANYVFRLRQRDVQGVVSRTVTTRPVTIVPHGVYPPAGPDGSSAVGGGSLLVVNPFQWPEDAPLLIANSGAVAGGGDGGAGDGGAGDGGAGDGGAGDGGAGDGGAGDGNGGVIDGSGTISSVPVRHVPIS